MEPLGNAKDNMSILEVSKKDLQNLLKKVSQILGYSYSRPLCPGIISNFRIDHVGNCIIDTSTGLGCGWFLNEKGKPLVIENIRTDSIEEIRKKAFSYRYKHFKEAINILKGIKPVIGCGGGTRPSEWADIYKSTVGKSFKSIH
ncbi:MAG: hypothetical protein KAS76_02610 [Thermoplasmatales archaeon]|nr:hypothetical protein [Thermoplasmatales archaeon]MCK4995774.1 hypothetical protein [Thermoplasmatales archaeon]